jgi:lipopolysaccharide transport system permease protein
VNKTAVTFSRNAQVFGKVYFPRLAVPIATVLTNLLTFMVQSGVLAIGLVYYLWIAPRLHPEIPTHVNPNWRMLFLPVMLAQTAMLGAGIGCIISALTTRYRDLALGVGFGLQLWMYASSIIFPISRISPELRWMFYLNPMVPIVEGFRFALLGSGLVEKWHLFMSFGMCAGVLLIGVMMFNRVEQTVMDTV